MLLGKICWRGVSWWWQGSINGGAESGAHQLAGEEAALVAPLVTQQSQGQLRLRAGERGGEQGSVKKQAQAWCALQGRWERGRAGGVQERQAVRGAQLPWMAPWPEHADGAGWVEAGGEWGAGCKQGWRLARWVWWWQRQAGESRACKCGSGVLWGGRPGKGGRRTLVGVTSESLVGQTLPSSSGYRRGSTQSGISPPGWGARGAALVIQPLSHYVDVAWVTWIEVEMIQWGHTGLTPWGRDEHSRKRSWCCLMVSLHGERGRGGGWQGSKMRRRDPGH